MLKGPSMKQIDYITPSRNDNGEYSRNYMEHIVERRTTAKTVILKALILAAVIIANLALIVFITAKVPALMILPWFLSGLFVWWVYRFFNVEYEYVTAGGEMDFDIIYGKKQRKRMLTVKITDMEIIAPVDGNYTQLRSDPTVQKCFDATISPDAPNTCYATFHHNGYGKCILFFDVPQKTKTILRYYNPSNFKLPL